MKLHNEEKEMLLSQLLKGDTISAMTQDFIVSVAEAEKGPIQILIFSPDIVILGYYKSTCGYCKGVALYYEGKVKFAEILVDEMPADTFITGVELTDQGIKVSLTGEVVEFLI